MKTATATLLSVLAILPVLAGGTPRNTQGANGNSQTVGLRSNITFSDVSTITSGNPQFDDTWGPWLLCSGLSGHVKFRTRPAPGRPGLYELAFKSSSPLSVGNYKADIYLSNGEHIQRALLLWPHDDQPDAPDQVYDVDSDVISITVRTSFGQ